MLFFLLKIFRKKDERRTTRSKVLIFLLCSYKHIPTYLFFHIIFRSLTYEDILQICETTVEPEVNNGQLFELPITDENVPVDSPDLAKNLEEVKYNGKYNLSTYKLKVITTSLHFSKSHWRVAA